MGTALAVALALVGFVLIVYSVWATVWLRALWTTRVVRGSLTAVRAFSRFVAYAAVTATSMFGTAVTFYAISDYITAHRTVSIVPTFSRCTEDMPCWDCTIMGNDVCGWQR
jgi:hypothetical protein